jgi:hypothetical protein
VNLSSASIGFCLNVAAEPGPFALYHVNDIVISHPELYNDGRFMVQGLTREVERVMVEADSVVVNTFLEMEPEYVAGYVQRRR